MTHPYTITRREVDGLNFAIDWLDRARDRAHADDCRSREPSAQCSCGLHRVLSTLRQTRNDMESAMLSASDKPTSVLTDEEVSAVYERWRRRADCSGPSLIRAVEAAILEKLK